MRVLVACEFSGIVRDAFLAQGHDAYSLDVLPTESSHASCQGRHIRKEAAAYLLEAQREGIEWDLMIAHPPCTHLASSGAR
jgi:hypothetical protein